MTNAPAEDGRPAILVLDRHGLALAERLLEVLQPAELWAAARLGDARAIPFETIGPALCRLFAARRPIVAICAAGIVIRSLAALLADKTGEPPVLAVAADGSAVVPLLGGHRGANALARRIGRALSVDPALTTASELALGLALDELPAGWRMADRATHAGFARALIEEPRVRLKVEAGDAGWLRAGGLEPDEAAGAELLVTWRAVPAAPERLVLHPPVLALGVGSSRGADPAALREFAARVLDEHGLAAAAVACVVSADLKADEPAIHALAAHLGVPARFFAASRLLEETPRLTVRSAAAFAATGCWGVAEGAALAAVGPAGRLLVPKRKSREATLAVALSPVDLGPAAIGQARGRLVLVGLGPGDRASRTAAAEAAIRAAEDVVGYRLYLDLAADLLDGKVRHAFPLGAETERCRHAIALAATGRHVALLASGDPGIYAMASLVSELLADAADPATARIAFAVVPGVSAMQAAAAAAGAPLGHDFCAISLSDLLTPMAAIERRLEAAAAGDFVVALYNPVSATRRAALARARDILLAHRRPDTPVVVARQLGREGERVELVDLVALTPEHADMLTVLLVGSSTTRRFSHGGALRVWTPRGYGTS